MNLPDVIIRQATHDDIEAMAGLLNELFSIEEDFSFDPQKQRQGLSMMLDSNGSGIMVACILDKVIGMGSVQMLLSTAEGGRVALVEDMIVNASYRGHGIGKRLLEAIENRAVEKGAKRLQLLADKNNAPALQFYDKRRWRKTQLICLRKKLV